MRILYFDCFSGISGDMILGAMVDAGLDFEVLKNELAKLNLSGYELEMHKIMRQGIAGTKVDVKAEESHVHRHLSHINDIIDKSSLDDKIKDDSKRIFKHLAEAEAKVHDTTVEKIHFHEVGAVDAIVDIVGTAIGMKFLDIEKVYASRVNVGSGFVDCQHGRMPVPAPATAELLKGCPTYSLGIEKELTTPTGAAVLKTFAEEFGPMPDTAVDKIGYGAGSREIEKIPNLLRIFIGESRDSSHYDEVTVIEANLDDMNPEFYEHVSRRLFEAGALDVFMTPVFMKKNRPGTLLSVIADHNKLDKVGEIIFEETSSLGIRYQQYRRRKLLRESVTVQTGFGPVRIKVSRFPDRPDKVINYAPEYESCRELAEAKNIPLKEIYNQAVLAFESEYGKSD